MSSMLTFSTSDHAQTLDPATWCTLPGGIPRYPARSLERIDMPITFDTLEHHRVEVFGFKIMEESPVHTFLGKPSCPWFVAALHWANHQQEETRDPIPCIEKVCSCRQRQHLLLCV